MNKIDEICALAYRRDVLHDAGAEDPISMFRTAALSDPKFLPAVHAEVKRLSHPRFQPGGDGRMRCFVSHQRLTFLKRALDASETR